MDTVFRGLPTTVCRYEVRYNKIGESFSKSKILFMSACKEMEKNEETNQQAESFFDDLVKDCGLRSMTEGVRAVKGSYSELFICRAVGYMKQEGFHACAYYTLRRGTVPYTILKEKGLNR